MSRFTKALEIIRNQSSYDALDAVYSHQVVSLEVFNHTRQLLFKMDEEINNLLKYIDNNKKVK